MNKLYSDLVLLPISRLTRNNYRSHRIIDEMLEILAEVLEEPLLIDIRSSQAISLEIDESNDVSVSRQLDLHIR